jgi:hypothetical protein
MVEDLRLSWEIKALKEKKRKKKGKFLQNLFYQIDKFFICHNFLNTKNISLKKSTKNIFLAS